METLVKFCETQYNPTKGCRTLQIGSLQYYREMEDSAPIKDCTEGTTALHLKYLDGRNGASDALKALGMDSGMKGVIINSTIMGHSYPNCLIFCCSICTDDNHLEQAKMIDPKYDSWFPISDPKKFGESVSRLILKNLDINWFPKPDMISPDYKTRFGVEFIGRKIDYSSPKNLSVKDGDDIHDELLYRTSFVKSSTYSSDQEFRFLFRIIDPDNKRFYAVRKEPILLPVDEICFQ